MNWSDRIQALSPQQRTLLQARLERIRTDRSAAELHPEPERLVAYVVRRPGTNPTPETLQTFLRSKLPDHMVPSAFVFMDAFPLTANGKVDRRALRGTVHSQSNGSTTSSTTSIGSPPSNPIEEQLVKIWREVLGVSTVGIHDNFFNLGGHSLLVLRVLARIRKTFQIDLPLKTLFELPTVEKLAAAVGNARQNATSAPIRKIARLSPREFNSRLDGGAESPAETLITGRASEPTTQQ